MSIPVADRTPGPQTVLTGSLSDDRESGRDGFSVQRVVYVVARFPRMSEGFISGEVAELLHRGVDVRILSLSEADEGAAPPPGLLERVFYDVSRFDDILERFRPDVVHAHFSTEAAAAAQEIAARLGCAFTFTAHGDDVFRRPAAEFTARAAAAAAVITVTHANREHMTTEFGIPGSRVHVIPCGVDTNYYHPVDSSPALPLIVTVARLRHVKQVDLVIKACGILQQRQVPFRALVLGEGPQRRALEDLRTQLRLNDQVAMPGLASQEIVRSWWQRASVTALSSRREGLPVSLMEAAACGVPAVAPAVGGIPELVVDGETGILVPPGDPEALADGLQRILTDPPTRARMGAAARRRAVAHFSRASQIDRLLAVWSRVAAPR